MSASSKRQIKNRVGRHGFLSIIIVSEPCKPFANRSQTVRTSARNSVDAVELFEGGFRGGE